MKRRKIYLILLGSLILFCPLIGTSNKEIAVHKIININSAMYEIAAECSLFKEEQKEEILSEFKEDLCKEVQKLTWDNLIASKGVLWFVNDALREKYFKSGQYVESEFETIAIGSAHDYGLADGFQIQQIYDEKTWTTVWNELYKSHTPERKVPKVDFTTHAVILVIDNLHGGVGSSVYIQGIKSNTHSSGRAAEVNVEVNHRTQYSVRPAAMDRPFHVVKYLRK